MTKILPIYSAGTYAICVFLDYSACFDTLCRRVLLEKLFKYGVRGVSYDFFRSYLSNRNQRVAFKSYVSRSLDQGLGVIQGSRLGPLLYDVYSNDFNLLCPNNECVLYADDTCLVYTGSDLSTLCTLVNEKLSLNIVYYDSAIRYINLFFF